MRIFAKLNNKFYSARHFYLLIITGTLFYLTLYYLAASNENTSATDVLRIAGQALNDEKNYFKDSSRLEKLGRIVETSWCSIPDFDTFDKDVLPFIKIAKPLEKCNVTHFNWSYVKGTKLVINKTQVELDGYRVSKGFCCYKSVQRITISKQEEKDVDKLKNADNLIRYSKECISINKEETQIKNEFIIVECGLLKFIPVAAAYRGFHAFASLTNSKQGDIVRKKIQYWKLANEEDPIPPNVLIIGIDSTSRLNFKRNMFKTRKVLEELEAVEMMGYTKVGENTFPNFVPLTTGYSEEDLIKICYFTRWTKQDDCPYIWKRFDAANYITAHSEDAPMITSFNYLKTGFVKQPVDFFLRPLFLAAHDYGFPPLYAERKYSMDCIGEHTNDEKILSYVESVLELGHKNKTPVYSVSWSSDGSHGDMNSIQLVDDTYANFLRRSKDKGYLDNTILIFMGDHGYRFGPVRQTILGYYEDKLPNMWIRIPPWIKKDYFPEWQEALQANSRRLTSPYTLYWTLNLILETFSSIDTLSDSLEAKNGTGLPIPRKHRQNFFQVVPEDNKCSDVGVPEKYCACYLPQSISLNDPLVKKAVSLALLKVNQDLTSKCRVLKLQEITATTVMHKPSSRNKRFVVTFTTNPGNFILEVEVDYFMNNKSFDHAEVHRTSKVNQDDVNCVNDVNLELFCYCVR